MIPTGPKIDEDELHVLQTVKQRLEKGNFKDAHALITRSSKSTTFFSDKISLLKMRLLIYTGKFSQALDLAASHYQQLREKGSLELQFEGLIWYCEALFRNLEPHKMKKLYFEGKPIFDEFMRDLTNERKELVAYYLYIGSLVPLNVLKESLQYRKDNLAIAVEYFRELKDNFGLGLALNNLGYAFFVTGELNASIECHQEALMVREQLQNKHQISYSHANLGIVYRDLAEGNLARYHLNKSLEIVKEMNNEVLIAEIIWNLAIYAYRFNVPEKELLSYLDEVKQLDQNNNQISYFTQFIQAIVLKRNKRIKIKFQAEDILKGLIEREFLYTYAKLILIELLLDLLIDELRLYSNMEVLEEIKHYNSVHLQLTREIGSIYYQVMSLSFQSKLLLIEGNITDAEILLDEVIGICQRNNLVMLEKAVFEEKNELEKNMITWNNIVASNAPMYERIKKTNIINYLNIIKKTKNSDP